MLGWEDRTVMLAVRPYPSALVFEPGVRLRDFGRSGVTAWL